MKDVYENQLNTWHDVSYDTKGEWFAYSTERGTVMYGMDLDTKDKFFASINFSPFYLETGPDVVMMFDTFDEAKASALKLVESLPKK